MSLHMESRLTGGNGNSIRWCPSCDLPLRRRVNTLSGTVTWRTTSGEDVWRCPRCLCWLPLERPEVALTNLLLAEAGEPATCAEELERGPWKEAA